MQDREDIWPVIAACADSEIPVTLSDPEADGSPLVHVNSAFEALVERTYSELVGRGLSQLFGGDTDPDVAAQMIEALQQGRSGAGCLLISLPGGALLRMQTFLEPIAVAKERVIVLGCHYRMPARRLDNRVTAATDPQNAPWHGVRKTLEATLSMQQEALKMRSDGMFKLAKLMLTRRRLGF